MRLCEGQEGTAFAKQVLSCMGLWVIWCICGVLVKLRAGSKINETALTPPI